LLLGAGAVALAAPAVWSPSRAARKRIVVRDDGGIYTKAYGAVFYRPFTEATGIEVVGVQANAEPVAQIKTMVDTKNYTWDMAKISWPAILLLASGAKPYLEKHGLESESVIKSIPVEYMSPYGVGTNVYTTVLAYRSDAFKGRTAPQSWADFWNVAEFPGRRAVRKHPFDTIEEALMAVGVPTAQVYPCDADKAFASLDKIKSSVAVWWTSGAQSAQAAGAPVEIVWNQGIWGGDNWSILAGTPNADACREFIKFASDPKRQAALVEYFPAGLTQPEAFSYVKPDVAKNCPTYPDNIKAGLKIDAKYWFDNQATVIERFNSWILA
jgi:putative spermidine/putrescine transport system substrate-binding protein